MKIVVKRAGYEPEVKEIENELRNLQEIVGGHIECFGVFDNVLCICDEEGKLKGYLPNFIFNNDVIVGNVIFCAAGEDDFESLNDEQIERIMHIFEY